MGDRGDHDSNSKGGDKKNFRGRGQRSSGLASSRSVFDRLDESESKASTSGQKSVEGYILCITNVHEEAQEDDLLDAFQDVAEVANIHLNLDRRTGFVKGYALLEFKDLDDAKEVIKEMNNKEILGKEIQVDWAFVKDGTDKKAPPRSRRQ